MKKLLNKKGSVLFLVVVVMSLLIIAASATYYVVSSQRSSVEVHYATEQSYQTALSVSETVEDYFTALNGKIASGQLKYEGSLFDKMMKMQEGESHAMTSDGNDLAKYGLGDFDIKIVKMPGSTTEKGRFEVTTTAQVKEDPAADVGEKSSLTQVWEITHTEPETEYFTRFLTSTGEDGIGRDVYLSAHTIFGDAYFENEFTSMGNTIMNKSYYSLGTLVDRGIQFQNASDLLLMVGQNYYFDSAAGSGLTVAKLYVKGDMHVTSGANKSITSKAVYVCGDVYFNGNTSEINTTIFVKGDFHLNGKTGPNTIVYVSGDLYVCDENTMEPSGTGTFYVEHNVYVYDKAMPIGSSFAKAIYCRGDIINCSSYPDESPNDWTAGLSVWKTNNHAGDYGDNDSVEEAIREKSEALSKDFQAGDIEAKDVFSSWNDVERYITNNTTKGTYKAWNAEQYYIENYDNAPTPAPTIDIDDQLANALVFYTPNADNGYTSSTEAVDFTDGGGNIKLIDGYYTSGRYMATITGSCRLHQVDQGGFANLTLLFDTTGLAPDETMYIYLDSESEDTFSFFKNAGGNNILIRGSNPVVFILPKGKNYKQSTQMFLGHEELAKYFAGLGSAEEICKSGEAVALKAMNKLGQMTNGTVSPSMEQLFNEMFEDDPITGQPILNSSTFPAGTHNNIFLVSTGEGTAIDCVDGNQFTYCGYIYAPRMLMNCNGDTGAYTFVGGLIIGSYTYKRTSSALAFVNPNPSDIVNKLMSEANEGIHDPIPDDTEQQIIVTADLIGYK